MIGETQTWPKILLSSCKFLNKSPRFEESQNPHPYWNKQVYKQWGVKKPRVMQDRIWGFKQLIRKWVLRTWAELQTTLKKTEQFEGVFWDQKLWLPYFKWRMSTQMKFCTLRLLKRFFAAKECLTNKRSLTPNPPLSFIHGNSIPIKLWETYKVNVFCRWDMFTC